MNHVTDSTHHPRGEHALWEEVKALRRLLREGEALVDQLECLAVNGYPALYDEGKHWREKVREVLGGTHKGEMDARTATAGPTD